MKNTNSRYSHHQGHGPCHHHHHHHTGSLSGLKWAFWINLLMAAVELVGGIWSNSVAIISDSIHDFGDAFSVLLMIFFERKSGDQRDSDYTFGYRRFSVFGAMVGGGFIAAGSIMVLAHSLSRLWDPEMPNLDGMLGFAVFGIVANGIAVLKVWRGERLVDRVLVWHLVEDVFSWGIVLIGALVLRKFPYPQIDSLLAIVISLWILLQVFRRLKEATSILLMSRPMGITLSSLLASLQKDPRVQSVHHPHLWTLDGEKNMFTCHLVVDATLSMEKIEEVKQAAKVALEKMGVHESTIEIEPSNFPCSDPEHKF